MHHFQFRDAVHRKLDLCQRHAHGTIYTELEQ